MVKYRYKKPHSINWVSILIVLVVGAAIYLGVKFGPVYWQAQQVDRALDDLTVEIANIDGWTYEQRRAAETRLVAKSIAKLHEMGIEDDADQPVQVWVSDDAHYVQARYRITVHHPFTSRTTQMLMERKVKVPSTKAL